MNSMAQIMPAPPTVKVYYGRPILPDVSRVLACLYEKEVDFELVDMYKGQRMPADILKLQATMRAPVPAFEDSNKLLLESRAICRYVAEKYADQGNRYLLGRDLLERGSIEQWLKTEEHSFNPPSWTIVFHLAFNPLTYVNEQEQSLIAQSGRTLAQVLDVYEHRLGESKFLAGDEFTLADLSHLPNAHYLANSNEWRYLFASRKNVQRWWEKISSRHSWEKVVRMLKEDVSLKNTSTVAEDVATSQVKSPQQQSSEPTGSSAIQLGRLSKFPDRASLSASPETRSEVGQPISSATQSNSTMPAVPESKPLSDLTPQPQQGDSSISQLDTTMSKRREKAPEVAESKPQSETRSQPQQGDSSIGQLVPDTTMSNLSEKVPESKPQSETRSQPQQGDSSIGQLVPDTTVSNLREKVPESKPQSETRSQPQQGDSPSPIGQTTSGATQSKLGADASAPTTPIPQPQLKETPQPQQGDSPLPIGQTISGATQSKLGADASAPTTPIPQPQLKKTPQPQQGDSPSPIGQTISGATQSKLGADASTPTTLIPQPQLKETSQPQQGDSPSPIGQTTSGGTQSKLGADASAPTTPIPQPQLKETPQPQQGDSPSPIGQTTSGVTQSKLGVDASAPTTPIPQPQLKETPQPQQGDSPSPIGQTTSGATQSKLGADASAPTTPIPQPQLKETPQPQQADSPSPIGQTTSDATQSKLGADASAPRAPTSQSQLDKTPQPQGVSKPQLETAPQPQGGELSTGQSIMPNLGVNTIGQPKETQPPQGDSLIGQQTSGTTQSKLGADASAPKTLIPQPQLKETPQPQGDTSTPQRTSVNTPSNLGEGALSNPQSKTSPQPQQGDPLTDQSKSAAKESTKGADAPVNQSIPSENPETQKIGQADSTASSATSNKPNAQSPGDGKP